MGRDREGRWAAAGRRRDNSERVAYLTLSDSDSGDGGEKGGGIYGCLVYEWLIRNSCLRTNVCRNNVDYIGVKRYGKTPKGEIG